MYSANTILLVTIQNLQQKRKEETLLFLFYMTIDVLWQEAPLAKVTVIKSSYYGKLLFTENCTAEQGKYLPVVY